MLTLEQLRVVQDEFCLTADLTIETGQIAAVIGPSGGGKSTLLSVIAGFISLTYGTVKWQGNSLNKILPGERPITTVFQDHNLFPHLTAFENVALGVNPSMRLNHGDTARVQKAMESVDLGGFETRKPAALSGGQASRVVLARVLVRDKPLLLLDEPFAALGPALRCEMLDLVAELAKKGGATVLMVTHNPEDAIRIASQTIYVEGGIVEKPVGTDLLMKNPPEALRVYLGR